jgi:hypothetical protein
MMRLHDEMMILIKHNGGTGIDLEPDHIRNRTTALFAVSRKLVSRSGQFTGYTANFTQALHWTG